MDKAKKELKQKLVDKFNIDFTDPEYTSGDKQLFYALFVESCDEYEGSQKECTSLKITIDEMRGFNANQMKNIDFLKAEHAREIKCIEEVKTGLINTRNDLEEELFKVRSECDKLKAKQAEDQNKLVLAEEQIQGIKEVASNWEHKATHVRKIPFLGTDTLSYQSDFILRWKEHLKEWNDLVSDFQNKYLPVSKEAINSFILRVKNVEL